MHLRIPSPPVRWPCFYGIDTGTRAELLAAQLTVDEIRDYLDVDTLAYLTLDRLVSSTGTAGAGFCTACFTGSYPVDVPVDLRKGMLETKQAGEVEPRHQDAAQIVLDEASLLPADDARRSQQ